MTETLIQPRTTLKPDKQPNEVSHIVDPRKWSIVDAMVFGTKVEALCGRRGIPFGIDGSKKVCSICKSMRDELKGRSSE